MEDKQSFFSEQSLHFFRPLTGKYREKARACIHALYLRLNGPLADCAYHLNRQDVLDIFLHSLSQIPEFDDDDTGIEITIRTDAELAAALLKTFINNGWIERYQDDVGMRTAFRFTPKGRVFAKGFVDVGRDKVRANNRNTRNTRSALQSYLDKADPYDLVEADRFAQEVFNDFNESIEEVDLMQQLQAQEICNELQLEEITGDFFKYLEKKFMPSISKMLGEDSIKRYQAEIRTTIENLHNLPDLEKAHREVELRQEFPIYLDMAGDSIYIWLLNQIERRINNACEIKLPELRRALDSYTRRTQLVIRQLTRIYASQQQDVDRICRRLANLGQENADRILTKASGALQLGTIKLINPYQIRPPIKIAKTLVNTTVVSRAERTIQEVQEIALKNALEVAFSIEDKQLLNSILEKLQNNQSIRTRHFDINTVDDLFAAMHLAAIGSIDHNLGVRFVVEKTGESVTNSYFNGHDFRIRMEPL